jgi:hypothetical protein
MMQRSNTVSLAMVLLVLLTGGAYGQDRAPTAAPAQATPAVDPARMVQPPKPQPAPAVRVQIVAARYSGDKKISSHPYELVMFADGARKLLRVGAEVPLSPGTPGGKENTFYKSIGTDIVCEVSRDDAGRFRANVTVTSSSLYPSDQRPSARPTFRNYNLSGVAHVRDGQTTELATATDTITGEVIKVEVTVNVVK